MRIAHVLSSLNVGGQERVALDLAEGQRDLGHEVVTIALDGGDGPLRAEFEDKGLEVVSEPKGGDGFDVGLWRRLGALFRERRLDVVHTHNPQPLYYASVPAKLGRVGLVHTKHGVNPAAGRQAWMRRGFGMLVDRLVAVSQATAEVARRERECLPGRLVVVENGIDLSRFPAEEGARAAVRAELGIPADAFVVGTVGRIYHEKAHPFLLRSLERELGDDFHVVIVGDGPQAEELRALVGELRGAHAVHLTGNRRDIPRVLAAFDVFVLPSVREGLPLVIPEAMATRLPVVATAVGGVPRVVIEGETGFLIESGDGAALHERIARLRGDGELARKLGDFGRKVALERYAAARMVRDYLKLYEMVVRP